MIASGSSHGLPAGPHPNFEIDYLAPLGVGGADDDRNLWPEPRRSVEPIWYAEAKDRLELRLNAMICAGEISPVEAQKARVRLRPTASWACWLASCLSLSVIMRRRIDWVRRRLR
jgi:hypothetical protein